MQPGVEDRLGRRKDRRGDENRRGDPAGILRIQQESQKPCDEHRAQPGVGHRKQRQGDRSSERPEESDVGARDHVEQKVPQRSGPGRQHQPAVAVAPRNAPHEQGGQRRAAQRSKQRVRAPLMLTEIDVPADRHQHGVDVGHQRAEHARRDRPVAKRAPRIERHQRAAERDVGHRIHAGQSRPVYSSRCAAQYR
jgi:hypothetical protein